MQGRCARESAQKGWCSQWRFPNKTELRDYKVCLSGAAGEGLHYWAHPFDTGSAGSGTHRRIVGRVYGVVIPIYSSMKRIISMAARLGNPWNEGSQQRR